MLPATRLVVIAPVFNHGRAIGAVLDALAAERHAVIVVNDGSTDSTARVLDTWLSRSPGAHQREVIAHSRNLGKAAALRAGFLRARERGFTHALTIDTDGQHDVRDVDGVVRAAANTPNGLIVGGRDLGAGNAPAASRIGCTISNWLVWCESGVRLGDTQSGMRIYPLRAIDNLDGGASRYGFETQVITRAGWFGVPVVEVPIRCIYAPPGPGGRDSHFRLVFDSLLAMRMHAALLTRALFFVPADRAPVTAEMVRPTGSIPGRLIRWFSPRRLVAMARGDARGRKRLAASVGVGLVMAAMPVYGIKTALCLWLAGRFRLHPLAVIGVSSLSTPPLGLFFIVASICAGHLLMRGSWPPGLAAQIKSAGFLDLLGTAAVEWAVGSMVVGAALGLLGYVLALALLSRVPHSVHAPGSAEPAPYSAAAR
jgi:uncharacterized protein (DUF2062 family)